MKKLLALLLIALLLPWTAVGEEGAYLAYKAATRTGPGTQYSENLGTLEPPLNLTVISYACPAETEWYLFTRKNTLPTADRMVATAETAATSYLLLPRI